LIYVFNFLIGDDLRAAYLIQEGRPDGAFNKWCTALHVALLADFKASSAFSMVALRSVGINASRSSSAAQGSALFNVFVQRVRSRDPLLR
jgi:hypothetical protein